MQVSETGDLANWVVPNKLVKGMGMLYLSALLRDMVIISDRRSHGSVQLRISCCCHDGAHDSSWRRENTAKVQVPREMDVWHCIDFFSVLCPLQLRNVWIE